MQELSKVIEGMMKDRDLDDKYRQLMAQVYQDSDIQAFLHAHSEELSQEILEQGETKLYEFVVQKQHPQEAFAPGYQPMLVLSGKLIDIEYRPSQALEAKQATEKLTRLVKSISMPKFVQSAAFSNFDASEPDRAMVVTEAINFVEAYTTDPERFHPGLYLDGNFGVGKTFLLGATANELAKHGVASTLVHFPTLAVELRNAIGNRDNSTAQMIDSIRNSPVLMLDDIGADAMSSWIRDDVLGVILEHRMQAELPTFFSSNFSMKQLEDEHLAVNQKGEVEKLKAKRIMERIRFLAKEVTMTGKNRRPRA